MATLLPLSKRKRASVIIFPCSAFRPARSTSQIATNVKSAVFSLRDLLARVDLARQSLDLAQVQYDLAAAQYANGVISHLDVLTASVTLTTAQVNSTAAQSSAQLGVLALQNAMGQ